VIILTGGFHGENLKELVLKKGYSYISILPKFEGSKNKPYFKLLSGEMLKEEEVIREALDSVIGGEFDGDSLLFKENSLRKQTVPGRDQLAIRAMFSELGLAPNERQINELAVRLVEAQEIEEDLLARLHDRTGNIMRVRIYEVNGEFKWERVTEEIAKQYTQTATIKLGSVFTSAQEKVGYTQPAADEEVASRGTVPQAVSTAISPVEMKAVDQPPIGSGLGNMVFSGRAWRGIPGAQLLRIFFRFAFGVWFAEIRDEMVLPIRAQFSGFEFTLDRDNGQYRITGRNRDGGVIADMSFEIIDNETLCNTDIWVDDDFRELPLAPKIMEMACQHFPSITKIDTSPIINPKMLFAIYDLIPGIPAKEKKEIHRRIADLRKDEYEYKKLEEKEGKVLTLLKTSIARAHADSKLSDLSHLPFANVFVKLGFTELRIVIKDPDGARRVGIIAEKPVETLKSPPPLQTLPNPGLRLLNRIPFVGYYLAYFAVWIHERAHWILDGFRGEIKINVREDTRTGKRIVIGGQYIADKGRTVPIYAAVGAPIAVVCLGFAVSFVSAFFMGYFGFDALTIDLTRVAAFTPFALLEARNLNPSNPDSDLGMAFRRAKSGETDRYTRREKELIRGALGQVGIDLPEKDIHAFARILWNAADERKDFVLEVKNTRGQTTQRITFTKKLFGYEEPHIETATPQKDLGHLELVRERGSYEAVELNLSEEPKITMAQAATPYSERADQEKKRLEVPTDEVNDLAVKIAHDLQINPGTRILSLGAGDFRDELYFAKLGCRVTTIEQVKREIDDPSIEPIWGDIREELTKLEGQYDIIYARLSLHYFTKTELEKIFQQIHRLLRSGGHLCVLLRSTDDWQYVRHRLREDNDTWLATYYDDVEEREYQRQFFNRERIEYYLGPDGINLSIVQYNEPLEKLLRTSDFTSGKERKPFQFIEIIAQKTEDSRRRLQNLVQLAQNWQTWPKMLHTQGTIAQAAIGTCNSKGDVYTITDRKKIDPREANMWLGEKNGSLYVHIGEGFLFISNGMEPNDVFYTQDCEVCTACSFKGKKPDGTYVHGIFHVFPAREDIEYAAEVIKSYGVNAVEVSLAVELKDEAESLCSIFSTKGIEAFVDPEGIHSSKLPSGIFTTTDGSVLGLSGTSYASKIEEPIRINPWSDRDKSTATSFRPLTRGAHDVMTDENIQAIVADYEREVEDEGSSDRLERIARERIASVAARFRSIGGEGTIMAAFLEELYGRTKEYSIDGVPIVKIGEKPAWAILVKDPRLRNSHAGGCGIQIAWHEGMTDAEIEDEIFHETIAACVRGGNAEVHDLANEVMQAEKSGLRGRARDLLDRQRTPDVEAKEKTLTHHTDEQSQTFVSRFIVLALIGVFFRAVHPFEGTFIGDILWDSAIDVCVPLFFAMLFHTRNIRAGKVVAISLGLSYFFEIMNPIFHEMGIIPWLFTTMTGGITFSSTDLIAYAIGAYIVYRVYKAIPDEVYGDLPVWRMTRAERARVERAFGRDFAGDEDQPRKKKPEWGESRRPEFPIKPEEIFICYKRRGETNSRKERKSVWNNLPPQARTDCSMISSPSGGEEGIAIFSLNRDLDREIRSVGTQNIPVTYELRLKGQISPSKIAHIRRGIDIYHREQGGRGPMRQIRFMPDSIEILYEGDKAAAVRMVFPRKLKTHAFASLEQSGFIIQDRVRTGYGPVTLGNLSLGEHRQATWGELIGVMRIFGIEDKLLADLDEKQKLAIEEEGVDREIVDLMLNDPNVLADVFRSVFLRPGLSIGNVASKGAHHIGEGGFKRAYKVDLRIAGEAVPLPFVIKVVKHDVTKSDSENVYDEGYAKKIVEVAQEARTKVLHIYPPVTQPYFITDRHGRRRIVFIEGMVPPTNAYLNPTALNRLMIGTYMLFYLIFSGEVFIEDAKPHNIMAHRTGRNRYEGTIVDLDNIIISHCHPHTVLKSLIDHGFRPDDIIPEVAIALGTESARDFLGQAAFIARTFSLDTGNFQKAHEAFKSSPEAELIEGITLPESIEVIVNGIPLTIPAGTTAHGLLSNYYLDFQHNLVLLDGNPIGGARAQSLSYKGRTSLYRQTVLQNGSSVTFHPIEKVVQAVAVAEDRDAINVSNLRRRIRLLNRNNFDSRLRSLERNLQRFVRTLTPHLGSEGGKRLAAFRRALDRLTEQIERYLKTHSTYPLNEEICTNLRRTFERIDFKVAAVRTGMLEELSGYHETAIQLDNEFRNAMERDFTTMNDQAQPGTDTESPHTLSVSFMDGLSKWGALGRIAASILHYPVLWYVYAHEAFHWVADKGKGEMRVIRNKLGYVVGGEYIVDDRAPPIEKPGFVAMAAPVGIIGVSLVTSILAYLLLSYLDVNVYAKLASSIALLIPSLFELPNLNPWNPESDLAIARAVRGAKRKGEEPPEVRRLRTGEGGSATPEYEHPLGADGANWQVEPTRASIIVTLDRMIDFLIDNDLGDRGLLLAYKSSLKYSEVRPQQGFLLGKDALIVNPYTGLPLVFFNPYTVYEQLRPRIANRHDIVGNLLDLRRESKGLVVAAVVAPDIPRRMKDAMSIVNGQNLQLFESHVQRILAENPKYQGDRRHAVLHLVNTLNTPENQAVAEFLTQHRDPIMNNAADFMAVEHIESRDLAHGLIEAAEKGVFDPEKAALMRTRDRQLLQSENNPHTILAIELQEIGSSGLRHWLQGNLRLVESSIGTGCMAFFMLAEMLAYLESDGEMGFNPEHAGTSIIVGNIPPLPALEAPASTLLGLVQERSVLLEEKAQQIVASETFGSLLTPTPGNLVEQINRLGPALTVDQLNYILAEVFQESKVHPMYYLDLDRLPDYTTIRTWLGISRTPTYDYPILNEDQLRLIVHYLRGKHIQSTEGDGLAPTDRGLFPHRGAKDTVNAEMVNTLWECIPRLIDEGRITEEDARAFELWLTVPTLKPGEDVPHDMRLPVEKLRDPDIEAKAFDGRTLRVVKLPVKELGRVNGEPFYGHVSYRDGIIWVAAEGVDDIEVELRIIHEEQEYNLAASAAKNLGLSIAEVAWVRDHPIEAAKAFGWQPFEIQMLFEIMHAHAWDVTAKVCRQKLETGSVRAELPDVKAALEKTRRAYAYARLAMDHLHSKESTLGELSPELARLGIGPTADSSDDWQGESESKPEDEPSSERPMNDDDITEEARSMLSSPGGEVVNRITDIRVWKRIQELLGMRAPQLGFTLDMAQVQACLMFREPLGATTDELMQYRAAAEKSMQTQPARQFRIFTLDQFDNGYLNYHEYMHYCMSVRSVMRGTFVSCLDRIDVQTNTLRDSLYETGTESLKAQELRQLVAESNEKDVIEGFSALVEALRDYPLADLSQELFSWILSLLEYDDFLGDVEVGPESEEEAYFDEYLKAQKGMPSVVLQPAMRFVDLLKKYKERCQNIRVFLRDYHRELREFSRGHLHPSLQDMTWLPTATEQDGDTAPFTGGGLSIDALERLALDPKVDAERLVEIVDAQAEAGFRPEDAVATIREALSRLPLSDEVSTEIAELNRLKLAEFNYRIAPRTSQLMPEEPHSEILAYAVYPEMDERSRIEMFRGQVADMRHDLMNIFSSVVTFGSLVSEYGTGPDEVLRLCERIDQVSSEITHRIDAIMNFDPDDGEWILHVLTRSLLDLSDQLVNDALSERGIELLRAECLRIHEDEFGDPPAEVTRSVRLFENAWHGLRMAFMSHFGLEQEFRKSTNIHRLLDIASANEAEIFAGKTVIRQYDTNVPEIPLAEGAMFRVFVNIIRDACEVANTITLQTSLRQNEVVMHISDNGPGMAPELIEAFNKGQTVATTHGEGRGRGLDIVRKYVADNGGIITVDAKAGRGTTFTISFRIGRETLPVGRDTISLDIPASDELVSQYDTLGETTPGDTSPQASQAQEKPPLGGGVEFGKGSGGTGTDYWDRKIREALEEFPELVDEGTPEDVLDYITDEANEDRFLGVFDTIARVEERLDYLERFLEAYRLDLEAERIPRPLPPAGGLARSYRVYMKYQEAGEISARKQRRLRVGEVRLAHVEPLMQRIDTEYARLAEYIPGLTPVNPVETYPHTTNSLACIRSVMPGVPTEGNYIDFLFLIENNRLALKVMRRVGRGHVRSDSDATSMFLPIVIGETANMEPCMALIAELERGIHLEEIFYPATGRPIGTSTVKGLTLPEPVRWYDEYYAICRSWRTGYTEETISPQGIPENLHHNMALMLDELGNARENAVILNLACGYGLMGDFAEHGVRCVNVDNDDISDLKPSLQAELMEVEYMDCDLERLPAFFDDEFREGYPDASVQYVAFLTDGYAWLEYYVKRDYDGAEWAQVAEEIEHRIDRILVNAWNGLEGENACLIVTEPGCERFVERAHLFKDSLRGVTVVGPVMGNYKKAQAIIFHKKAPEAPVDGKPEVSTSEEPEAPMGGGMSVDGLERYARHVDTTAEDLVRMVENVSDSVHGTMARDEAIAIVREALNPLLPSPEFELELVQQHRATLAEFEYLIEPSRVTDLGRPLETSVTQLDAAEGVRSEGTVPLIDEAKWQTVLEVRASDRFQNPPYEIWYNREGGVYAPSMPSWVRRAIELFGIDHTKRVLEVGTGKGDTAAFFTTPGATVHTIESNQAIKAYIEENLEILRNALGLSPHQLTFEVADARNVDVSGYDVIYFYFTFPETKENIEKVGLPFVRELLDNFRGMKPGAQFVLVGLPKEIRELAKSGEWSDDFEYFERDRTPGDNFFSVFRRRGAIPATGPASQVEAPMGGGMSVDALERYARHPETTAEDLVRMVENVSDPVHGTMTREEAISIIRDALNPIMLGAEISTEIAELYRIRLMQFERLIMLPDILEALPANILEMRLDISQIDTDDTQIMLGNEARIRDSFENLDHPEGDTRAVAAHNLDQLAEYIPDTIRKEVADKLAERLLNDDEFLVRTFAARALGHIGVVTENVGPALIAGLNHPHPQVYTSCSVALDEIGVPAIPYAMAAFIHGTDILEQQAIVLLKYMSSKHQEAVQAISRVLDLDKYGPDKVRRALILLGDIGTKAGIAAGLVLPLTTSSDPSVRLIANDTFSKIAHGGGLSIDALERIALGPEVDASRLVEIVEAQAAAGFAREDAITTIREALSRLPLSDEVSVEVAELNQAKLREFNYLIEPSYDTALPRPAEEPVSHARRSEAEIFIEEASGILPRTKLVGRREKGEALRVACMQLEASSAVYNTTRIVETIEALKDRYGDNAPDLVVFPEWLEAWYFQPDSYELENRVEQISEACKKTGISALFSVNLYIDEATHVFYYSIIPQADGNPEVKRFKKFDNHETSVEESRVISVGEHSIGVLMCAEAGFIQASSAPMEALRSQIEAASPKAIIVPMNTNAANVSGWSQGLYEMFGVPVIFVDLMAKHTGGNTLLVQSQQATGQIPLGDGEMMLIADVPGEEIPSDASDTKPKLAPESGRARGTEKLEEEQLSRLVSDARSVVNVYHPHSCLTRNGALAIMLAIRPDVEIQLVIRESSIGEHWYLLVKTVIGERVYVVDIDPAGALLAERDIVVLPESEAASLSELYKGYVIRSHEAQQEKLDYVRKSLNLPGFDKPVDIPPEKWIGAPLPTPDDRPGGGMSVQNFTDRALDFDIPVSTLVNDVVGQAASDLNGEDAINTIVDTLLNGPAGVPTHLTPAPEVYRARLDDFGRALLSAPREEIPDILRQAFNRRFDEYSGLNLFMLNENQFRSYEKLETFRPVLREIFRQHGSMRSLAERCAATGRLAVELGARDEWDLIECMRTNDVETIGVAAIYGKLSHKVDAMEHLKRVDADYNEFFNENYPANSVTIFCSRLGLYAFAGDYAPVGFHDSTTQKREMMHARYDPLVSALAPNEVIVSIYENSEREKEELLNNDEMTELGLELVARYVDADNEHTVNVMRKIPRDVSLTPIPLPVEELEAPPLQTASDVAEAVVDQSPIVCTTCYETDGRIAMLSGDDNYCGLCGSKIPPLQPVFLDTIDDNPVIPGELIPAELFNASLAITGGGSTRKLTREEIAARIDPALREIIALAQEHEGIEHTLSSCSAHCDNDNRIIERSREGTLTIFYKTVKTRDGDVEVVAPHPEAVKLHRRLITRADLGSGLVGRISTRRAEEFADEKTPGELDLTYDPNRHCADFIPRGYHVFAEQGSDVNILQTMWSIFRDKLREDSKEPSSAGPVPDVPIPSDDTPPIDERTIKKDTPKLFDRAIEDAPRSADVKQVVGVVVQAEPGSMSDMEACETHMEGLNAVARRINRYLRIKKGMNEDSEIEYLFCVDDGTPESLERLKEFRAELDAKEAQGYTTFTWALGGEARQEILSGIPMVPMQVTPAQVAAGERTYCPAVWQMIVGPLFASLIEEKGKEPGDRDAEREKDLVDAIVESLNIMSKQDYGYLRTRLENATLPELRATLSGQENALKLYLPPIAPSYRERDFEDFRRTDRAAGSAV